MGLWKKGVSTENLSRKRGGAYNITEGEYGVPVVGEHGVPRVGEHGVPRVGEHGIF